LLIAAVAVSFAVKIALAVSTYGSNDALTWEADAEKIHTDGALAVYQDGAVPHHGGKSFHMQRFSHPPFMIAVISAWAWLADVTGIPMRFWIRLACSVADVLSIILLLPMLRAFPMLFSPVSVLLVVLSPISVLISGFHVNTDPIMMSFVLLSVYLIHRGSPAWIAGCSMGMAVNIKIVPILFISAVCLYFSSSI
jgi:4-amino-4-deoxy-L-arabinose transferase-like glycosyltransferase